MERIDVKGTPAALALAAIGVVTAACAIRLGGPAPVEYRVLALDAGERAVPEEVARRIRDADANVVLLGAEGDTAWFAGAARAADLTLSGPGIREGRGLAFLATEPLGDTTVALPIGDDPAGPSILVHDALYEVDDDRFLDLLAVRLRPGQDVDAAIQALLRYIATDVMQQAAVALAVDVPDAGSAARAAHLLEPAFMDARDCIPDAGEDGGEDDASSSSRAPPGMLLFYGPELRMRCERAEQRREAGNPIVANLVVAR
ncbi:MAG: hypothetical protein ACODAE_07380 [Gemmatimonadota bacterium]